MENYLDKTALIIDLQNRGYDQDFILKNEGIFNLQQNEVLPPEEFEITETYIPPAGSKPGKNLIIYAIHAVHSDLKGILAISYAACERGMSIHLWSKLSQQLKC